MAEGLIDIESRLRSTPTVPCVVLIVNGSLAAISMFVNSAAPHIKSPASHQGRGVGGHF